MTYREKECKYLEITIHDNDFTNELYFIAEDITKLLDYMGGTYKIHDMNKLSVAIQHMWYGMYRAMQALDRPYIDTTTVDYFKPDLRIVDFFDINDWENRENLYIPLFKDGEWFIR